MPLSAGPSLGRTLRNKLATLVGAMTLAIVAYLTAGSFTCALLGFGIVMLLDADHLVDYLLYIVREKKSFDPKEFLSGTYFAEWKKFITPLHAWELVITSIIAWAVTRYALFGVVAASLTIHYIIDYAVNEVNTRAYWLCFRAKHQFVKAAIRADVP